MHKSSVRVERYTGHMGWRYEIVVTFVGEYGECTKWLYSDGTKREAQRFGRDYIAEHSNA